MLGTYPRALAAIGAASRNVEGTDYMEHFFLKGVGRRFVFDSGIRVVENAFFAGAGRTYIAAGIAAYAARQLILPESKALVRRHFFKTADLVKAIRFADLAVLAQKLVKSDVFF